MRYITPCVEVARRIPPGADHKQPFPDYRPSPGVAWRYDPVSGENVVVEIGAKTCEGLSYAWRSRWVDGRTVEDFTGPEGVIYSQPSVDDPRAKDRALGSTHKRSRFMASVQKARAEEAARQGKRDARTEPAPAPRPVKTRKPRKFKIKPMWEDA